MKLKELIIGGRFEWNEYKCIKTDERLFFYEGKKIFPVSYCVVYETHGRKTGNLLRLGGETEVTPIEKPEPQNTWLSDETIEKYYREKADGMYESEILADLTEAFATLYKDVSNVESTGKQIAESIVDMEDMLNLLRRKAISEYVYDKECNKVLERIEKWAEEHDEE